jgi:excisionase family DNA binding protein
MNRNNAHAATEVDEILKFLDLASYLNCHPSTIYNWTNAHKVSAFRLGSYWRLRKSDIDPWIIGHPWP